MTTAAMLSMPGDDTMVALIWDFHFTETGTSLIFFPVSSLAQYFLLLPHDRSGCHASWVELPLSITHLFHLHANTAADSNFIFISYY